MPELLPYFFIGMITGIGIAGVFGAIKLTRWQRTAAELESQLRSHSFELQITLEELAEKNQLLQQQTETDALSGVFNRAYFNRQMQAELKRSRREQRPLALVLLDIDYFKQINDNHGHLAGDQVIKTVASLMQQLLKRPGDKLCRYGGEEFALILPNTDLEGAADLAEHIRQRLDSSAEQPAVTLSAGCYSAIPGAQSDTDEYVNFADKALYSAKSNGRNQVQSYPPRLNKLHPERTGELHEH